MARRIDRILATVEKVKTNEEFAIQCLRNPNSHYRIHQACVDKWASCAEFACMNYSTPLSVKLSAITKWPSAFRKTWKTWETLPDNESLLYAAAFHHDAAKQLATHHSDYVRSSCARFKDIAWSLKDDKSPLVRASACQWPEVAKYLKNDKDYCVIVARIDHFEEESLNQYTKHVNAFIRLACATRWLSSAQVLVNDFEPIVRKTALNHLKKTGLFPELPSKKILKNKMASIT